MVRSRPWRTHVVRLYWRTRHLLLRFLCLHEAAILALLFFWPKNNLLGHGFSICTSATVYSGTLFSSRWSAMEYRSCQPPCARFITSDDPHSKCVKCLGFPHAREVVDGISKCKFRENLRIRTLRSWLEVFEKESSVFPRRSPEASAAPRESMIWGSDVQLEAMESEQTGLAFSLPLSPEHVHANSPVEFAHDYLYPSLDAPDTVSFGLDDILLTAASDSEDFGPVLEDALPHSGQEARPSTAYSELVAFHVPLRSSHWIGPMSPASLKHRNSTSGSLVAQTPGLKGGSCHLSAICIKRSPDPGSSLFPPILQTRQLLTSPTLWVLWSRAIPPFRWSRIL